MQEPAGESIRLEPGVFTSTDFALESPDHIRDGAGLEGARTTKEMAIQLSVQLIPGLDGDGLPVTPLYGFETVV